MQIKTRVRSRGGPKLMQRELNNVNRELMEELGWHWHRRIRPKHFRNSATTEYGYAPRAGERGSGRPWKGSYTYLKLRFYGHTRPLVLTGESEQATETSGRVEATATKTKAQAKVRMDAPALNFKNPKSRIDLRDELTRVSPRDEQDLTHLARLRLPQKFDALRGETTYTL